MKPIQSGELYQHLSSFLKTKGIDFQEGSYTRRVQKGCELLTKTINVTQETVEKAKAGVKTQLKKAKQVVHEKTAPDKPAKAKTPASAKPRPKKSAPRRSAKTTKVQPPEPTAPPA